MLYAGKNILINAFVVTSLYQTFINYQSPKIRDTKKINVSFTNLEQERIFWGIK